MFKMKKDILSVRECKIRESPLNAIYENRHIKSVYHFLVAVYFVYFLKAVFNDLHYNGGSQFGFGLIFKAFDKLHIALAIWCMLLMLHLCTYLIWNIWTLNIINWYLWTSFWALIVFLKFFYILYLLANYCIALNLGYGCRAFLLIEQCRFIMKSYAFLRYNIENYIANNKTPKLSQFLYFSFAPTCIYRQSYPRSPSRSWTKTIKYLFIFLCTLHFVSLLEIQYFIEPLQNFGKTPYDANNVAYVLISHSIAGFFILQLILQVLGLHLSQNIFAELLRFGDREFYKDWWTITSFPQFFTNWNVLIQNWLYIYIYKDVYEYIVPQSKFAARSAVFLVSLIFHEILLEYIAEIRFPLQAIIMVISVIALTGKVNYNSNLVMNIFFIAQSTLVTLFHLEWFVKKNCPTKGHVSSKLPRLYTCYNQ